MMETIEQDDLKAAEELLPEVYEQLRHLAAARLAHEKPGQTLQATALVHEAWLRVAGAKEHLWHSRAEFFHAAAQAMRRILVENARRKQRRRALAQVHNLNDTCFRDRQPTTRVRKTVGKPYGLQVTSMITQTRTGLVGTPMALVISMKPTPS